MGGSEFAGRLRVRAVLYRPSGGRDILGGPDGGWDDIGDTWASAQPEGHGAAIAGDARAAMTVWRVTMRPRDVQVGDRIEFGATTILVREVQSWPELPDRIDAIGEQVR